VIHTTSEEILDDSEANNSFPSQEKSRGREEPEKSPEVQVEVRLGSPSLAEDAATPNISGEITTRKPAAVETKTDTLVTVERAKRICKPTTPFDKVATSTRKRNAAPVKAGAEPKKRGRPRKHTVVAPASTDNQPPALKEDHNGNNSDSVLQPTGPSIQGAEEECTDLH
jgi:hypothetical protein